jgi:outer membrane protein TolC
MEIRYFVFIVFILLAPFLGYSQQYSLKNCEQKAVENNFKIKNGNLDLKAATETRKEAFTKYFPVVKAEYTHFNANKGLVESEIAMPGILPTPMPVSLLKNGTIAGIGAVQPIYAGSRIVNGNKLAAIGEEVSSMKLELTKDEVLLKTNYYYWQIVNLKEKLKTISAVELMINKLHKDVKIFVKAGVANRNDLIRVELRQQEVQSNRLKIENGLRVSKMLLAQFIGVDIKDFDIVSESIEDLKAPEFYYVRPTDAVNNRYESKMLDKKIEAAKLNTKLSLGEHLPSLAIGGGYLYHDLPGKSNNAAIMYASVSVPISGWWGGNHKVRHNKIKEQQAINEKQDAVELMLVEINQTWNELTEAYKQIILANKSIESSTENLRIVTNFYKAGVVGLTDVLEAQLLFRKSKNIYSDMYNDYKIKLTRYKQITIFE